MWVSFQNITDDAEKQFSGNAYSTREFIFTLTDGSGFTHSTTLKKRKALTGTQHSTVVSVGARGPTGVPVLVMLLLHCTEGRVIHHWSLLGGYVLCTLCGDSVHIKLKSVCSWQLPPSERDSTRARLPPRKQRLPVCQPDTWCGGSQHIWEFAPASVLSLSILHVGRVQAWPQQRASHASVGSGNFT